MKSNLLLSKGLHKLTDHASKLHTVSSFNEVCLQLLKYHRNSPTERFTDKTLHYEGVWVSQQKNQSDSKHLRGIIVFEAENIDHGMKRIVKVYESVVGIAFFFWNH